MIVVNTLRRSEVTGTENNGHQSSQSSNTADLRVRPRGRCLRRMRIRSGSGGNLDYYFYAHLDFRNCSDANNLGCDRSTNCDYGSNCNKAAKPNRCSGSNFNRGAHGNCSSNGSYGTDFGTETYLNTDSHDSADCDPNRRTANGDPDRLLRFRW